MTWQTESIGTAGFRSSGTSQLGCRVEAVGGSQSVIISSESQRFIIDAVDSDGSVIPLPRADEQYVRGDELHINFPQSSGRFAMRMALQVLSSPGDSSGLLIECRLSVQTDLLDSHPLLDLRAEGFAADPDRCVLLSREDLYHTQKTDGDRPAFRLFGDFLEKGVIRRARPWLVFGPPLSDPSLSELTARQSANPVTLGS